MWTKKTGFKTEVTEIMDQILTKRTTISSQNKYSYDGEDNNDKYRVVENQEWKPATDNVEIPDISDHYDGPHGIKPGVEENIFYYS